MRRLLILAAVAIVGCGSDGPTGTTGPVTFDYIPLTEFDGYVSTLETSFTGVQTMIEEFGAITSDFVGGYVSDYWIVQFLKNLIRRVDMMQAQAESIRPEHPELLKLHVEEYEASLADFRAAYALFQSGIENPGTVSTADVNDLIVSGNTHLIRLQILLGDLAGRDVDLFAQFSQGGGGGNFSGEDEFGF